MSIQYQIVLISVTMLILSIANIFNTIGFANIKNAQTVRINEVVKRLNEQKKFNKSQKLLDDEIIKSLELKDKKIEDMYEMITTISKITK